MRLLRSIGGTFAPNVASDCTGYRLAVGVQWVKWLPGISRLRCLLGQTANSLLLRSADGGLLPGTLPCQPREGTAANQLPAPYLPVHRKLSGHQLLRINCPIDRKVDQTKK